MPAAVAKSRRSRKKVLTSKEQKLVSQFLKFLINKSVVVQSEAVLLLFRFCPKWKSPILR
jgi:hypothetical protein